MINEGFIHGYMLGFGIALMMYAIFLVQQRRFDVERRVMLKNVTEALGQLEKRGELNERVKKAGK